MIVFPVRIHRSRCVVRYTSPAFVGEQRAGNGVKFLPGGASHPTLLASPKVPRWKGDMWPNRSKHKTELLSMSGAAAFLSTPT